MNHSARVTSVAAALLLASLQAFGQSGDGGTFPIKDFVASDTLKALGNEVEPTATIFNARATFTLNTASGPETVEGTVSMLERINELRAVETLEAMKKTDVYVDAVKSSAKAPVEYGKALVDAPVDTMKNTAKGLGGFFADIGYSIVSDDPSQDNVAKTGLGQSTAKRAFAFELGINPYTTYEPLQEALSEVSWAAVGGGLTVGAAFRAVQNMPGQVLRLSRIANSGRELVRDKSPRELKNRNEESLLKMGASEDLVEAMINNFSFDPETETRLVVALEAMDGVEGRTDLVSFAALASTRTRAHEMRDYAELIANFHEQVTPARKLVVISDAVWMIDARGMAHGTFPTDYIVPTAALGSMTDGMAAAIKSQGYKLGTLYVTGAIHPDAMKALKAAGWSDIRSHAETSLLGT